MSVTLSYDETYLALITNQAKLTSAWRELSRNVNRSAVAPKVVYYNQTCDIWSIFASAAVIIDAGTAAFVYSAWTLNTFR